MKRLLAILLALLLLMIILTACSNGGSESGAGETGSETEYELDWETALEDFLVEFLPFFTDSATIAHEFAGNQYEPAGVIIGQHFGWERFVQRGDYEEWEYPLAYTFHDPVTGNRVMTEEVPYLMSQIQMHWRNEVWDTPAIATGFALYDLDDDGIPEVLISWEMEFGFGSGDGGYPITIHQFVNGSYELAGWLWGPSVFYRDSSGRPIIYWLSWTDGFMESDFIAFNDGGIEFEPIIERIDGDIFYNHIINENVYVSLDDVFHYAWGSDNADVLSTTTIHGMPDEVLTIIEPMAELQESITETLTQRLKAEGRILSSAFIDLPELPAEFITTSNLHLREGPSTMAVSIVVVPAGTGVTVIRYNDAEWYKVEHDGQAGFMNAEFLRYGD